MAFSLRPYQADGVRRIFDHWRDGKKSVLFQCPTGGGKSLVANTPILMFDGTIKMVQDVRLGDLLMGDDSTPRTVLGTHSDDEPCYDIVPVKGDTWGCNESHILSLIGNANQGWIKKDQVYDIELRDYLKFSPSQKHILKQYRVGVEFKEQPIPIDPYLLGVWLGDGDSAQLKIRNPDHEIAKALELVTHPQMLSFCDKKLRGESCEYWAFPAKENQSVILEMRRMGLFAGKHIPQCYKANSRSVRLEVLAGLIDTDGYLGNGYEICAKSDRLADDILFLCRSLGFAAYCSEKWVTLKGWSEPRKYNRISISGDSSEIPVRVARKKAPERQQIKSVLRTGFKVVPRGVETYYGFEIDGNRRFLLGDFTVTHNTVIFNHITALCVEKGYRVLQIMDRRELISQSWRSLWKNHGIHAGQIISGTTPAYQLQVQIASIQTLTRRNFPPNIDLVIIDECRGSVSPSYAPIFEFYKGSRFLGVDATPIRSSGLGFDHLYEAMVLGPSIKEMENIWRENPKSGLVPAKCFRQNMNPKALADLGKTGGDYNERQLAELMMSGSHTSDLVASWLGHANGLKTIAFAVNIAHSKQICEKFKAAGIPAAHVDGESPDRDRIFADFAAGKYRVLVNVGVATYGYDEPSIMAVLLARPTMSLSLYLQMIGRGARPYAGKQHYILLDCANCLYNHGLPNEDRKWSLKGTKKEKKPERVVVVGADGQRKVVRSRDLPETLEGVTMEEVTPELLRQMAFDKELRATQQRMGNQFSAFMKFRKKYHSEITINDLKHVGRQLGYKPGWATFKMEEIIAERQKQAAQ